jgi:hypothetical protein
MGSGDRVPGGTQDIRKVTFGNSPVLDAFGRLRISDLTTLFDSKQIFDNQPLFWDDQETSGTGTTSTHSVNTASTTMAVGATTGGKRVRQTMMRFNYQPGKSQLILMTGTFETGGGSGIVRGMGYYDDNNGIFFQDDEGTLKVVRRTKTSGSVVDNKVAQSDWNMDKLDGTGDSRRTLDMTKSNILIIDIEWLGVGRVRVGFVIDGLIIYVHQFLNANNITGVYMSTPNLPLRYEIENDGTGVASDLEHICSSVASEGGVQSLGILRHKDTGTVGSLSSGTKYAVLGIRLKSANVGANILLESLSMALSTVNDYGHWELKLNPTIADASSFSYSGQTNSSVEIAIGSNTNTVTVGTDIDGGYITGSIPATATIPNALRLGSLIDGTVDEIVLCFTPITNNISAEASLTWRELS